MKKEKLLLLCALILQNAHATPTWNWSEPEITNVSFPQQFIWGAGTSALQVEGNCTNTSWATAEQTGAFESCAGIACDHWNRYKEDIQLLASIGLTAYRFSVEWSKIEPHKGIFDEEALQHYQDVVDTLVGHGIKPIITLHHYTDPRWFADEGGFEQPENIHYFVAFARKVIDRLQPHGVYLWLTFNSPDGYAARGYLQATQPPFKRSMALMAEVYKNVLEAHVLTYRTIKPLYGQQITIGIMKNILQLDPYNAYNPLDLLACNIGTDLTDTSFFTFFTQGTFNIWIPWLVNCSHTNRDAIGALDCIGLNYYSHSYMRTFKPTAGADEEKTDNPNYVVYPEGMYRALMTVNDKIAQPLGIPIYVTENGIATTSDEQRDRFLKRYIYAIYRAMQEGVPVKGYLYWSLLDNYEWGSYTKKYGLYAVDFLSQKRTLKPSAAYLTQCAQTSSRLPSQTYS